jgi:hypothetical protein
VIARRAAVHALRGASAEIYVAIAHLEQRGEWQRANALHDALFTLAAEVTAEEDADEPIPFRLVAMDGDS